MAICSPGTHSEKAEMCRGSCHSHSSISLPAFQRKGETPMARKRTKYTLRKDGRIVCLTPSMASESILWKNRQRSRAKSVTTISVSAKSTRTRQRTMAVHSRPSPMTGGSSANRACLQTPYAVTEQQRIALWTLSATSMSRTSPVTRSSSSCSASPRVATRRRSSTTQSP